MPPAPLGWVAAIAVSSRRTVQRHHSSAAPMTAAMPPKTESRMSMAFPRILAIHSKSRRRVVEYEKSPGAVAPGLGTPGKFGRSVARVDRAGEAELVVHAELDRMDLLVDVGRCARRERHCLIAEVHVVVFELRRPGGRERILDAGAGGPADAGVGYFDSGRERVAIGAELVVRPGDA